MFSEDSLVPISALQHLLFCERQAALIHLERLWAENRFTAEGRILHARAHGEDGARLEGRRRGRALHSRRGDAGEPADISRNLELFGGETPPRIVRALPLRSHSLGLYGVADVIEFHPDDRAAAGSSNPFPVEYKRGGPKPHDADRVQLCAQALCLEEMLRVTVPRGALFYARTRRREPVAFDEALRRTTREAAGRMHEIIASGRSPPAVHNKKCKRCSLLNLCLPSVSGASRSAAEYTRRAIAATLQLELLGEPPP